VETYYTHTIWRVREGCEEEFVQVWSEWADWSHREGLEAPARLLRDVDRPRTFVSFAPWGSVATVQSWRGLPGYHERLARLAQLVDGFEPQTLEVVVEG
jgi:hypothetical protein